MIEIDIKPKKDINVEFNIPIQTISGETVSDYNQLNNKPKINNIELAGDKTLDELGIQSKGDYLTKNTADKTYQEKGNYALKTEIPTKTSELKNDSGFLESIPSDYKTKDENDQLYQPKGNYALKSEIPDTSNLITKNQLSKSLQNKQNVLEVGKGIVIKDNVISVKEKVWKKIRKLEDSTNQGK